MGSRPMRAQHVVHTANLRLDTGPRVPGLLLCLGGCWAQPASLERLMGFHRRSLVVSKSQT